MVFCLNNKYHLAVIVLTTFLAVSCKNDKKLNEIPTETSVEYIMYQPSEMAGFMNAMYAYNQQLKAQIMAGETPTNIPLDLLKLHSAEMSDGKHRTDTWQNFVNVFIESQKEITNTTSSVDLTERYNTAINNCISCHKTECVGPIPKITKLLIQ